MVLKLKAKGDKKLDSKHEMTRDELIKSYELTDEQAMEVAERIFNVYTYSRQALDKPYAVVVLGQAGAGKSGVMAFTENQLPNAIALDIDDLRKYHPKCQQVKAKHPEIYEKVTGGFASKMIAILTPWLINPELVNPNLKGKHFALILHKTRGTDEIIKDTIIPLKETGYDAILRVLAVSELESKMSCLERSLAERDAFGCCRWVEKPYQDKHYKEIVNLSQQLVDKKLVDAVEVYTRGKVPVVPNLVYSSVANDELYQNPSMQTADGSPIIQNYNPSGYTSVKQAIDRERDKAAPEILKTYPERLEKVMKKSQHGREDEFIQELIDLQSSYQNSNQ